MTAHQVGHPRFAALLVAGIVSASACAVVSRSLAAQPDEQVSPQQQQRLQAMQAKAAEASLTIFPVVLWNTDQEKQAGGAFGKEVANVVGVLLEKAGMDNLETTTEAFVVPAEVDFDQSTELFGAFVRRHPIKTDYALYGEYVGRTGPVRIEEVRSVIVDKAGQAVWLDRQRPQDADFKRVKPECPMTCSVLLTQRLGRLLDLSETPRKDAGKGKFAQLMARKSGLPDKTELAAMEQRLAVMKKAGPTAKVAVFPIQLADGDLSKKAAGLLVSHLNNKGLLEARMMDATLAIELQRTPNEAKALWDLARSFRDHLKQNPQQADYALFGEYAISPRDGRAMAVHFVVCDQTGQWVIVDLQNDHHGDFQSIDPKSLDDCARLMVRRLEGYLK